MSFFLKVEHMISSMKRSDIIYVILSNYSNFNVSVYQFHHICARAYVSINHKENDCLSYDSSLVKSITDILVHLKPLRR